MAGTMPGILASGLVLLALTGCTRQGLVADDPYERPVSRLLREATGIVRLRRTTLKECAPEYHTEAPEGLDWSEALALADRRFGTDKVKRALFLRKCCRKGQPARDLRELGLWSSGSGFSTGGGRSVTLVLVEGRSQDEKRISAFDEGAVAVRAWVSHGEWVTDETTGEGKLDETRSFLLGPLRLSLCDVELGGITFASLMFDIEDRLVSFSFSREGPETRASFKIGGNTTGGWDNSDFYWAWVKNPNGQTIETRNYDQDLLVLRRSAMEPGSAKTRYADTYVNGVPYERLFYHYPNGYGLIVRKARFVLPRQSIDRAALKKAVQQLASDDPHGRRRARHTLILAGQKAIAAMRAVLTDADERQVLEFVEVFERLGSPDAIELLVELLGHRSKATPGKASDALIHIGEPSSAAVLRALDSPDSSERALRCCSRILGVLAKRRAE